MNHFSGRPGGSKSDPRTPNGQASFWITFLFFGGGGGVVFVKVDICLDSMKGSVVRALAMDNLHGIRIGIQWSSVEILSSFLAL